ncbi:MAG TPA: DUF2851 family protein [Opitutaceae bacterium]|nr:DUF2851 family protein [Opitutaceae bacterium]
MVRAPAANASSAVAEIQGLYGAFSFPEKLLQKIWLRGDFDRTRAFTTDGRLVRIVHPGKWNLLGGPDFSAARLAFGGERELTGDVEVHLHAGDWDAHGHARDRAYDGVALHVVLFPPERGRVTRGAGGREISVLALLPLLHHDLEEYAAEEAVEVLANRPSLRVVEELASVAPREVDTLLRRHAHVRWRQKIHFARLRVQRLGWDAACHHAALEILGFRFNRAPMLRLAGGHPLAEWTRSAVDVDALFAEEAGAWSLQGVRPANHPRVRLRQYAAWTRAVANWPERLAAIATTLPAIDLAAETRAIRRAHGFAALSARIADEVCGGAVSGPRFDTLVCDGLLPLLAARTDAKLDGLWFHWFAGDLPPFVTAALRQLAVCDGRTQSSCHGFAQGVLGWLIERDAQR